MMNSNIRKHIAIGALALMSTSIFASVSARASGCRDYYAAYVDQATSPTPTVIVDARPNYHGHYAEYHGRDEGRRDDGRGGDDRRNNNDSKDDKEANKDAAIAAIVILAALSTTTAVQDAELRDAQNVINDIDQAGVRDGAQLRQLQAEVQSNMPSGKVASLSDVANAVEVGNSSYSFCQGGNLDSESELAARIANSLAAK